MKNKGILSKQCIKRLKPIKSTDVKQAHVPTLRRKNKNMPSINILSLLFSPLLTRVPSFSAWGMSSFSFCLPSGLSNVKLTD